MKDNKYNNTLENNKEADESNKLEALKILYIEDNINDQIILQRSLKKWCDIPFQIETVETGREGLQKISEKNFDLILLDYYLPDMNGSEVLNEIYAKGIKVPIIVITGRGDLQVAVEFMKRGVYDYITKDSIDTPKLSNSIRELLLKFTLPNEVDIDLVKKVFELLKESAPIKIEPFIDVKLISSSPSSLTFEDLNSTLKILTEHKFITAKSKKTILACPECNSKKMQYRLNCFKCGDSNMITGEVLEHFTCGHIDFLSNFQTNEGELECPKCNKHLNLIGVNYRKVGVWYNCSNDHLHSEIYLQFKCEKCDKYFKLDDAVFDYIYEYHLNPIGKQKLNAAMLKIYDNKQKND